MRTYAVIADGSLRIAYEKGEIKKRYWNPGGLFEEVHVLVLADDDIAPELVQSMAGQARLEIHPIGRPRPHNLLALRRAATQKMEAIQPDIIRGHGSFLQGYYAVYAARSLRIPCFVSIHDDLSIYRRFWTYGKGYVKITAYQLALKALGWERFVYANADCLVPKYEAAARLLRRSPYRDKVRVIYNQVFLEQFGDLSPRLQPGEPLRIINVGRQFAGKDQRPLIGALAGMDAQLTLIGQGPMRAQLVRMADRLGVSDRVTFIDSVPNAQLPEHFRGHHVFAINMIQPGVCMPAMEAMALGFPVVINRPRWGGKPEICGDSALIVDGSPDSYRLAYRRFLESPGMVAEMGGRSREAIGAFSGEEMERQEKELMMELTGTGTTVSAPGS